MKDIIIDPEGLILDEINKYVDKINKENTVHITLNIDVKKTVIRADTTVSYVIDKLKLQRYAGKPSTKQEMLTKRFNNLERKIYDLTHINITFEHKTRSKTKRIHILQEHLKNIASAVGHFYGNDMDIFNEVSEIQKDQKEIIKARRKHNSKVYKIQKENKRLALKKASEGKFGEVDDDIIKSTLNLYNCAIIDKSSKHRAVLYARVNRTLNEFDEYYWSVETLCLGGIDDNDEQWEVDVSSVSLKWYDEDDPYDGRYQDSLEYYSGMTVEDAMSDLFHISVTELDFAERQGDVLFISTYFNNIDEDNNNIIDELSVAESHRIKGKLKLLSSEEHRVGDFIVHALSIRLYEEGIVEHTQHPPLTLE